MTQDILITPGSGEPQILFRGSGTNDTPIELNVLSSYQSATGSGTALIFQGTQGQLFGITDNLSSGVIFSVSDITGLPAIEYDASGDLKLGEYADAVTIYSNNRLILPTGTPGTTTNSLYNVGGVLYFNGSGVSGGGGISNVVEDTTPQLGGDLDLNGNQILDAECEASLSTNVALTAKGATSQSASFFEVTDSTDTVLGSFYPTAGRLEWKIADGANDTIISASYANGTAGYCGTTYNSDGEAYIFLDRGNTTDWADVTFQDAGSSKWRTGLEANQTRFAIYDFVAGNYVLYAPNNGTDVTTNRTWHFNKAAKGALNTESDGATVTFDLDKADTHTVTLGGNRILALSNADVGQRFVIRLVQDGTGTRTVTWFSTIKWPGGLVPTLTTTGGKTDVFGFICTSAGNYDGFVIGYNL